MPMLRKIDEPTQGNKQAWSNTFTKLWKKATEFLQNFPNKCDGGITVKRRTPNQTSEYELDVRLIHFMHNSIPPTTSVEEFSPLDVYVTVMLLKCFSM